MEKYTGADPLAEWCAGEMKLEIDGKALIIKPTMEHYRKLNALVKKDSTPEDNDARVEILKDILRTTFPNSSSIDDFMLRYEQKFQIALFSEMAGIPQDMLKKKFMQEMNAIENSQKNKNGNYS